MSKVSRWIMVVVVVGLLGVSSSAMAEKTDEVDSATKTRIQEDYGKLPLYFIQNDGQMDEKVRFYEKGNGHSTFFTSEGVYLQLNKEKESQLIKLFPQGANKNPEIIAEGQQKGKINYFVGKKENWKTNIPTYKAVIYKDVYAGIDMKFYGNNNQLEYDIIVEPGMDPSVVKMSYEGIESLEITDAGELRIVLKDGFLTQKTPYLYQDIDGKRVKIEGKFRIINPQSAIRNQQSTYGFEVASYNKNYPLIIDPVLEYSTYLGGDSGDGGSGIAVDTSGNTYITGSTYSSNFPTTSSIQESHAGGGPDVFVTKINAAGDALDYSTYLGGSGVDNGYDVAVDTSGNAYITGQTNSFDFPTVSPVQGIKVGIYDDAFITKIDASGSNISYSTYVGGNHVEWGWGVAVDTSGNAYITGHTRSTDFPTVSPIQGNHAGGETDVFITKIDASGSSFAYSTYLGGSGDENSPVLGGRTIAVDTSGNAYVTGYTSSTDFPTVSPIQRSNAGFRDAFITKIEASGSSISYSTYLGGSSTDDCYAIAIDTSGNAYITGKTNSNDFPTTSPFQGSKAGNSDVFITKIDVSGSNISYSTYLGGSNHDRGSGVAVDNAGNSYITGYTESTDFPTASPIQMNHAGGSEDVFITKIDSTGSSLSYSSYLGGSGLDQGNAIAVDSYGNAFLTGRVLSTDFPTVSPIQGSLAGGGSQDAFVAKIAELSSISVTPTSDDSTPLPGGSVCIQTDVADVTDLYAASFDMVYSNTVVTFNNATEGSFLDNGTLANAQMLAGLLDGNEGQLVVGITRLGDIGGISGSGDLADICLDVVGASCSSTDISFTNTYLEGPTQGSTIAASWGTTSISVALPDPTGLATADAGSHDQINLSWTASAGATSYDIYRSDSPGSGFSFLDNTAGTTYPDSDCIIPTLSYYYYVIAKVGSCESNPAAEASGIAAGLLGDINNDGRVDGRDLSILARNFGTNDECQADLDRTDLIDGDDLIAMAANFGLTLP